MLAMFLLYRLSPSPSTFFPHNKRRRKKLVVFWNGVNGHKVFRLVSSFLLSLPFGQQRGNFLIAFDVAKGEGKKGPKQLFSPSFSGFLYREMFLASLEIVRLHHLDLWLGGCAFSSCVCRKKGKKWGESYNQIRSKIWHVPFVHCAVPELGVRCVKLTTLFCPTFLLPFLSRAFTSFISNSSSSFYYRRIGRGINGLK